MGQTHTVGPKRAGTQPPTQRYQPYQQVMSIQSGPHMGHQCQSRGNENHQAGSAAARRPDRR